MHKSKYWEDTFEDSMDLVAKLPVVAATIYNNLFRLVISCFYFVNFVLENLRLSLA